MPAVTLVPDYHERRTRAQAHMKRLGWGAQSRASFAVQLAPTLVSRILNGTYENADHLAKIEGWLSRN